VLCKRLGREIRVEKTAAVPYGAMKGILSSHYENVGPFGKIQRALDRVKAARDEGTCTKDMEMETVNVCRCTAELLGVMHVCAVFCLLPLGR
jgi:hypothetical protein